MEKRFVLQPFKGTIGSIEKEWESFHPTECLNCHATKEFQKHLFSVKPKPKTFKDNENLKQQLEKQGINEHGIFSSKKMAIITAATCSACKSQNVVWDL